jgi:mitochondrial-processing peptidase subunit beta
MMINKVAKTIKLIQSLTPAFSQVVNASKSAPVRRQRLQFSKHRLIEFGELPHGEIPEALAAIRPTNINKLSNEIRVGTETWTNNQPA